MRRVALCFILFAGEAFSGNFDFEIDPHRNCRLSDNVANKLARIVAREQKSSESGESKFEENDSDRADSKQGSIDVEGGEVDPEVVTEVVSRYGKPVEWILENGSKLLQFDGDDFETSEAKCQRVTQAYRKAFSVIKRGTGDATESLYRIGQLLDTVIPSQLFRLVRRSKLAGRFGDGGYMKINGQLRTLDFLSRHAEIEKKVVAVLVKFDEGLTAWQKQGKSVSIKTGGLKLFWERKIRDGFSWFLSRPSFTYPPGYLLALLCAVTSSKSQSAPAKEVKRILGPRESFSQKRFDRQEVVGRILDALENCLIFNPNKNAPVWLIDVKEQAQDLMKMILAMDILMTNRRRNHKSVAAEVDTFEMGARVPGELFARFMMDKQSWLEKEGGVSEALKGLDEFSKFVFFSQTLAKSVEYSKEGRLSEDDALVRNGGSYIFSLLDELDDTGEVRGLIDLIRRKNSGRIAGKVALGTLMVLVASCYVGLLGPLVAPASFAFLPWTLATR